MLKPKAEKDWSFGIVFIIIHQVTWMLQFIPINTGSNGFSRSGITIVIYTRAPTQQLQCCYITNMKIYRPKRDQRETKKTSEGLAARPKKIIFHKKKKHPGFLAADRWMNGLQRNKAWYAVSFPTPQDSGWHFLHLVTLYIPVDPPHEQCWSKISYGTWIKQPNNINWNRTGVCTY